MTMPYSPSRAIYEGNSAATRFPFSFKVWDASQLVVTLTSPEGLTTQASGWTANLGAAGGEVVYQHDNTPLPDGWKLAITRNMPFTQEVNLVSASRFDPQVIEDALDQATAERQQTLEMMQRAVILPATSSETPQDVVLAVYAARDNATAAASSASASQSASAVSAGAAADSAVAAAQTVAAATVTAVTAATAQASRAEEEADRAKDEADRATDMANIGPATADKLGFVKIGEGIAVEGDGTISAAAIFAICSTGASATEKAISLDHFALVPGAIVQVVFANVNTAVAPTLNINGTGAKPITCHGIPVEVGALAQGQVYTLIYSGSAWQIIGGMSPYPIGQYVWWEDTLVRPGFQPANANIVANFAATYPQMAAYLSTAHGARRCFASLAQYEAAHKAAWATLADGSKVSWNNIGGVAKFFWNKAADTLLMPDLTEMTRFMAGASLDVGVVLGDETRDFTGSLGDALYIVSNDSVKTATGVFANSSFVSTTDTGFESRNISRRYSSLKINASASVPTGAANAPRRWGALACCWLGVPAS